MKKKGFFFLFLLKSFSLLGVSFLCFGCHSNSKVSLNKNIEKLPDQTISDFKIKAFSQGIQEWVLTSPRAFVYETVNRIDIDSPIVQFYEAEEKGSILEAENARIDSKTNDMWVWDNVVIVSTDGARLSSDWMEYKASQERILSTAPVTIIRGDSTIRGVGWEADPDLSEVVIYKQTVEIDPKDQDQR